MADKKEQIIDNESLDNNSQNNQEINDKYKSKFSDDVDEFALVSAVWILACNDPFAIMTFDFIKDRLQIKDTLLEKIIADYKALFTDVPSIWVKEWQHSLSNAAFLQHYFSTDDKDKPKFYDDYISSRFIQKGNIDKLKDKKNFKNQQLPSRIANKDDIKDKFLEIQKISDKKTFMSQFRLSPTDEPSPIEILEWGLEYIEKHREIKKDIKEEKWKKWKEFVIPSASIFASILIALGTIVITSYWQFQSIKTQKEIKNLEVSYKPKQESYTSFVSLSSRAFDAAQIGNKTELSKTFFSMQTNLFLIESLVKNQEKMAVIWNDFNELNKFLVTLSNSRSSEMTEEKYNEDGKAYSKLFGKLKSEIYEELFSN